MSLYAAVLHIAAWTGTDTGCLLVCLGLPDRRCGHRHQMVRLGLALTTSCQPAGRRWTMEAQWR